MNMLLYAQIKILKINVDLTFQIKDNVNDINYEHKNLKLNVTNESILNLYTTSKLKKLHLNF
jgi:hypothetical protein